MQTTFFYLERFLKKLADDHCSSITKGSIYHVKHMYVQPFTTVVDWPEIGRLMEVSSMFYICRYCVLLGTAELSYLYTFVYRQGWTNPWIHLINTLKVYVTRAPAVKPHVKLLRVVPIKTGTRSIVWNELQSWWSHFLETRKIRTLRLSAHCTVWMIVDLSSQLYYPI